MLGRNHLDDDIPHADRVARGDLDQFTVAQPPQSGHGAQRAARDRHRNVPRQDGKRPEVEIVGVQMRHNDQIGAAGPVVGQRPPSPAQVPQPRAEQRIGEDTNAAVVDRAGRVPLPGDLRHLTTSDSPSRPRVSGSGSRAVLRTSRSSSVPIRWR